MRRRLLFGLILAAGAILPASAEGDGLPVLGVDVGPTGVTTAGSVARYVTIQVGRDTMVARVRRDGGQVLRSRVLDGSFTIPAVALDGSASGLSADRDTLVLIEPRKAFPRRTTTFAILDARRLRVRDVVTLRGDFSFDALSPDGASLYLIQYVSRRDPRRYGVRAYDLRAGRLLPRAVADPSEPDEQMRGYPVTRATSPGGRWEYTLYDGAGSHPFIHALDTVDREAVCIDLHALTGHGSVSDLRLTVGGGGRELSVVDGGRPVAVVDTAGFRLRAPAPARPRPTPAREASDGRAPWTLLGTTAAALLLAGGAAFTARRRRPVRGGAAPAPDGEDASRELLHS